MTTLPAASAAIVADEKIRDYLLDETNENNLGKAALFTAFGFAHRRWAVLQQALRRHAVDNEVSATRASPYGTKFVVSCRLQTPDGRNPCIKTIWIVIGDGVPRLVTAYK